MADRLREQEMRLTIPAAGEFRVLATELAGKFAEYLGIDSWGRGGTAAEDQQLAVKVTNGAGPDASIDLDMTVRENVVVVRVSSGSTSDDSQPVR